MSIKGDALSAASDFQVYFVDACAADAQLSALLGVGDQARIFASEAPQGTPYPYVTLGLTQEADNGISTFDKYGVLGQVRPDIWTDRTEFGNMQGLAIYRHLRRLFHGKTVALPDHDVVTCVVELVIDMPDVNVRAQHTQVLITPRSYQR
jgi:hypothetical protein